MLEIICRWETRKSEKRRRRVLAKCPACGAIVERSDTAARVQKSCGCLPNSNYKHGKSPAKLYHVWQNMRKRCRSPKATHYDCYGGRGISVCAAWEDFTSFRTWAMQAGWKPNLTIDRRNNDGNYEPSNCRFVTNAVNCQNRTTTKLSQAVADQIRSLFAAGLDGVAIAAMFQISSSMAYKIRDRRAW